MAYIVVEGNVARHKKFLAAGPAASWLWVCGLSYCQQGLTDGFIPEDALKFLGVDGARRLSVKLVESGLWEACPGGWQMHDYLDHNKSAEEIRKLMKRRGDGGVLGGRPKKNLPQNLEGSQNGNLPVNHSENPLLSGPIRSDPFLSGTGTTGAPNGARASGKPSGIEPVWTTSRSRPISLVQPGNHGGCYAPESCARGLCLPVFLGRQWAAQLAPDDPVEGERAVRAFVTYTLQTTAVGAVGEDPLKFWRAKWHAYHGSTVPAPAPKGRGEQALEAAREAVLERQAEREQGR
jgi:hypothetical protein